MTKKEPMSNVLSASIVTKDGIEYLCADCNYGEIGVDGGVFARRKEGSKKWRYINIFDDRKSPVADLYVFKMTEKYKLPTKDITVEEFKQVMKEMGIEDRV